MGLHHADAITGHSDLAADARVVHAGRRVVSASAAHCAIPDHRLLPPSVRLLSDWTGVRHPLKGSPAIEVWLLHQSADAKMPRGRIPRRGVLPHSYEKSSSRRQIAP
jgi:hypothetical protein